MPNWCYNELNVIGEIADINKFVNDVKSDESPLSFEKLFPVPQEIKNTNAEKISYEHYEWCFYNWGTRSEADDQEVDFDEYEVKNNMHGVVYTFATAWSPPNEWLKYVAVLYPTLRFDLSYEEPLAGYEGHLIIDKGQIQLDVCDDYNEHLDEDDAEKQLT